MAQLAIVPCGVCRAIVLMNKQIYTKQYLTNLIFMKTNTMTEIKGYEAPNFDVVLAVVERGFEASMPGVTINPWESEDDSLEF